MKAVSGAFRAIGLTPKVAKPGPAPTMPTRDDARDAALRDDELRKRRGSGADMITGAGGAEARSGAATLLG